MPSSASVSVLSPFRTMAMLVILLLVAHAPLFLNNGVFMDDWLVLKLSPDYPVDIDFLIKGAGHPIFFGYYTIANMTGAPVTVMVIMAVFGIFAGAICLALAAMRTGLLSRAETIGVALIVWTYPGYQMWAGKTNGLYVFSFGLFAIGTWLLTLAFDAKGVRHAVLRVATTLAFFVSFALNSLMVLHAFVVFGLFVAIWRTNDWERGVIRRSVWSAWRCVAGYPELVVLPFVYWGALNIWFKRVGAYSGYYGVRLPRFSELLDGWHSFFEMGCINVLARAAQMAKDHKFFFVLIALMLIITFVLARKGKRSFPPVSRIVLPMLLSALLFGALALPYLIAGIRPSLHFYETRHLLLFGLPGAFSILAAKRLMGGFIGDRAAVFGVFGLAAIVSVAALWNNYVFMQARTLKQEALFSHLAAMPLPAATVYNLDDGFYDHSPQHVPFGLAEVTGMLWLAWGNHPLFGFSLQGERPSILQEMESGRGVQGSAFRNMDPSGSQATILLRPGPAAGSNAALVRHYYACRLLPGCDVASFISQIAVVKIDVGPIVGVTPLAGSK